MKNGNTTLTQKAIKEIEAPKHRKIDLSDAGASEIKNCLQQWFNFPIIAEGPVNLKTVLTDFSAPEFYWNHCLDDYWRNFYTSRNEKSISGISLSFGIIILQPTFWEILEINQNDFLKSSRKQYHKRGSIWTESEIEPV